MVNFLGRFRSEPSRWVSLPKFRGRKLNGIAVESIAESESILRDHAIR
jgi:hypothetical protein